MEWKPHWNALQYFDFKNILFVISRHYSKWTVQWIVIVEMAARTTHVCNIHFFVCSCPNTTSSPRKCIRRITPLYVMCSCVQLCAVVVCTHVVHFSSVLINVIYNDSEHRKMLVCAMYFIECTSVIAGALPVFVRANVTRCCKNNRRSLKVFFVQCLLRYVTTIHYSLGRCRCEERGKHDVHGWTHE